ncbi:MAG: OmpH family outer membrane protein [Bacteroidales bacterium]|jgi:outer membrane protein|nr:OmpH family outer membrane protein [Bacteroidales bacterium]MDX9926257.1 OmpH family outer membrane protein [Bacteroidales bacterium]HNX84887.1 OmpH family outer membrane protein [Bacteroidales bacterium]
MKKVFGILLFAALFLTAQDGFAQSFKTGHINRDDIIMAMPDYDTAMKSYNAFGQELTNALELMQVELNNKYDQFTKEEKNLTDLVKANRAQEITDMQTRISNFQQQAQVQLQEKQAELLNPIIEKANNAINAVAKEGGYIYIYDVRTLVYVDTVKSTDIGPLVKTKLGIK